MAERSPGVIRTPAKLRDGKETFSAVDPQPSPKRQQPIGERSLHSATMMTSLQLPPPRKATHHPNAGTDTVGTTSRIRNDPGAASEQEQQQLSSCSARKNVSSAAPAAPPSYEERCRAAAQASRLPKEERPKLFVPRTVQDFGDGGAFPEIHVAQYPRHMGNPHLKQRSAGVSAAAAANPAGSTSSRAIVNVEVDKDGQVSYDAIVKGGTNSDKLVYTKLEDMRGGPPTNPQDLALPTAAEEAAEAAKTQAALQSLLAKKTALDKPSGSALAHAATSQNAELQTQFIAYTPRPDVPGYNPAAAQRVIQMVPAQLDPMMPPKHKHIKAPRGPAEDPVPILAAPPKKLTKEERDQWNIPACISNWKNQRGYTIPLDKRLAADGRGLQQAELNTTQFAALSESLYVAEQQARQEVRLRAQTQKKLSLQQAEEREAELRRLAAQARLVRSGGGGGATTTSATTSTAVETIDAMPGSDESSVSSSSTTSSHRNNTRETEEQVAARQREKLRLERKRERERELRLEQSVEIKKQRLEEERDVSEQIALGVHIGTAGGQDNVDSRLYQAGGGMDSGFGGGDDEYNLYSKPLFAQAAAASGATTSIYRPTRGETEYNADEQYSKLVAGATAKFQPDKGFSGAEGGADVSAGPRTAPVQFEKAKK